jgi:hypothetical protein
MAETKTSTGIPAPGMAVIGAGFGRTGTASLKQALEDLGCKPCDHMHENFDHPTPRHDMLDACVPSGMAEAWGR